MKDILEFGRFVGRIVEAHNQGDRERERQLANDAELHFDLYGIPDYDSETGRTVEETPFDEVLSSESRKNLDGATKGEAYLQRLILDTRELKANAEAYLRQTEGQKAPGRSYMSRCADAAEGTLEYLLQLADRYQVRRKFVSQANTATPGECQGENVEMATILSVSDSMHGDGRESLCIPTTLTIQEKSNCFKALINANVFVVSNSGNGGKDFAAFRTFFFGDVTDCEANYKLTVGKQSYLAAFLQILKSLEAFESNEPNKIAALWCNQGNGKPLNTDSMKTTAGNRNTQLVNIAEKYFGVKAQ